MSTVKDIIDAIKHRLPDRTNLYPALNTAVRLISKRLYYHKASMVQDEFSETLAADSNSLSLPTDFWALIGKPYISGKTWALNPIPNKEDKLLYTAYSTPEFYELMGQTLHFYYGTSSEITIKGDYWKKETKITKPSSDMPFYEMFDDAIQEGLIHYYMNGNTTGEPNAVAMMANFINKSVDEIVPYLDKTAPVRFEDTNSLDDLANEGWY